MPSTVQYVEGRTYKRVVQCRETAARGVWMGFYYAGGFTISAGQQFWKINLFGTMLIKKFDYN